MDYERERLWQSNTHQYFNLFWTVSDTHNEESKLMSHLQTWTKLFDLMDWIMIAIDF